MLYKWNLEALSGGRLRSKDIEFMARHGVFCTSKEWDRFVSNEYDGVGVIFTKGYHTHEGFVFASDPEKTVEYVINEHGEVIYKDHVGDCLGTHVLNSGVKHFHLFRKLLLLAKKSDSAKRFMHFLKKMEKLDSRGFAKIPFDLGIDVDCCVTLWEEMLLYSYWSYDDCEIVYLAEKDRKY